MSKELVYILTNPCLDGWVKIGMTSRDDIQKRLDELNQPANIPLMFRAYALYHVENALEVEKAIHNLIDLVDDSLHARETMASGRVREREFFQISPERAYSIFKQVASLRGDIDKLDLCSMTEEEQAAEEVVAARRPPFRFSMVDVPVGAALAFIKDDSITCRVVDDRNHIEYDGEITTMSALAARLSGSASSSGICGPTFFTFAGEPLSDRRARFETNANVDDE